MIRYDLLCGQDHAFDGWFANSSAYDRQAASGLVSCPHCGDTSVRKAIMAPRLGTVSADTPPAAPQAAQSQYAAPSVASPEYVQMIEMVRRIKQHIEKTSENVGSRFAEEARKIHYNEAERRSIYGEATAEEAHALVEEGIEIHALPRLPEEAN